MKLLKYTVLLIISVLAAGSLPAQDPEQTRQSIEVITAHITDLRQKSSDTEVKIAKKIRDIKSLLDDYTNSEKSLKGPTGLGRIEQLELKAERYSIERQARKKFEKEVDDLIEILKYWENCKNQIKDDKKLLELKQKIMALETAPIENKSKFNLNNKQAIEYYEVKKDAPIRDISALPEVYGNSTMWKNIYDANRDKIKDPAKPIPAGTTLTVPNTKASTDFDDLK